MAVFGRKGVSGELPPGAINLRNEQVHRFYELVVETWEPKREIWALTMGPHILGAAGALSGMYGNMYFRNKMRLKNYGFISTYLPNMVLPYLIVSTFHTMFIQKDIYVDPFGCTLCKSTKAAALQVGLGLIQPLILVPASTFMFATRHFTYRIPSPISDTKNFWNFCKKVYKPLQYRMGINAGLQTLLAFFITHMEENHFFYLQKAIVKREQKVEVEES